VVEYGLLIASIAVLVLLTAVTFGMQVQYWFSAMTERIVNHP